MPAWEPRIIVVTPVEEGARLDMLLFAKLDGFSRERVRLLLREGRVRVDGAIQRTSARVRVGATVTVLGVPPPGAVLPVPNAGLPLVVAYCDEYLLIVDKPAGMACVPLSPDQTNTLANALAAHYPELGGVGRGPLEAGLLHRLDNDTSGLLLVARTTPAFVALRAQLEAHEVEKRYWALVAGQPEDVGIIEAPVAHATADRRRMSVKSPQGVENARGMARGSSVRSSSRPASSEPSASSPAWCGRGSSEQGGQGRMARTEFRVLARGPQHALLEVSLRQGVRHQIRAHLASRGHPLAGDTLYGGSPGPSPRHFLHASDLLLRHPVSGESLWGHSDLPAELSAWLVEAKVIL
jgi:23S rRNA pseudouridine1911/1915/1917 synthase